MTLFPTEHRTYYGGDSVWRCEPSGLYVARSADDACWVEVRFEPGGVFRSARRVDIPEAACFPDVGVLP